jgi:hypothetical protein
MKVQQPLYIEVTMNAVMTFKSEDDAMNAADRFFSDLIEDFNLQGFSVDSAEAYGPVLEVFDHPMLGSVQTRFVRVDAAISVLATFSTKWSHFKVAEELVMTMFRKGVVSTFEIVKTAPEDKATIIEL